MKEANEQKLSRAESGTWKKKLLNLMMVSEKELILSRIKYKFRLLNCSSNICLVCQVTKLTKILEDERAAKEHALENRARELSLLETKFATLFEQETTVFSFAGGKLVQKRLDVLQARKESEIRMLRYLEERFSGVRNDIAKEGHLRAESLDSLNQALEVRKTCLLPSPDLQSQADLPKLYDSIKLEAGERENNDLGLMKRLTDEIGRLNVAQSQEKKSREEIEQTIFEMIKDVVNRVKNEIDSERRDRETTEDQLLSLLEETCTKLNSTA